MSSGYNHSHDKPPVLFTINKTQAFIMTQLTITSGTLTIFQLLLLFYPRRNSINVSLWKGFINTKRITAHSQEAIVIDEAGSPSISRLANHSHSNVRSASPKIIIIPEQIALLFLQSVQRISQATDASLCLVILGLLNRTDGGNKSLTKLGQRINSAIDGKLCFARMREGVVL